MRYPKRPTWCSLLRIPDGLRPWLIALAWLVLASLCQGVQAEEPPDGVGQGLTLVTPFSAGSGPDQVARVIAQCWSERIGEPVEVQNMPDRQGYTAARWVSTARADGRLLLLTSDVLLHPPPRRASDEATPVTLTAANFTPLARVGQLPFVTVLPAGLFGRRLTPLTAPQALPVTMRAPAPPALFSDLRDGPWNALLAPPRMPPRLAERLRAELREVLADPRVRLALAQTGTELWEVVPASAPAQTVPLPPR
ncbi:hypothetical protein CDN99_09435 [Roseateles aquatilis]|uniref:Tripartite tricarboxylate transporter substrate binding protein n=1 Tax=Roseateles aquatilis TaxID=431061 RepID=A0A246JFR9_9BURK|nr:hypothetical protein [Roseateles aquatilis]OWQ91378.1 hypothetical protein CDN99_09435 [Roseateles aquatilis]